MAKNEELKKENIQMIRTCFYQGGVWTKSSLHEKTGLSLAGTTNVLQKLQDDGEILYMGNAASTGGRQSKEYTLSPAYCHIGTVLAKRNGSTYSYLVQILALDHTVLLEKEISSIDGSVKDMIKAFRLIKADKSVKVAAVSIPGICVQGIVQNCDFAPMRGLAIQELAEKECGCTCVIENDVNVACISYSSRYGKILNMAFVYQPLEEYIGVGIVLNGKLYNGAHHEAGEMRYLSHTDDKKEELIHAFQSLQAVLDPEVIVWHSDCIERDACTYTNTVYIEDVDAEIRNGLYEIGMHELLRAGKGETKC